MSRSVWKGPYVHPSILKKVAVAIEKDDHKPIKHGHVAVRLYRQWLV